MTAAAAAPPPRREPAAPRSLAAGHGRERGRGVRLPGGVHRSPAMAGGEASLGPAGLPAPRYPRSLPEAGVPPQPSHGGARSALPRGCPAVRQQFQTLALCRQLWTAIFRKYRGNLQKSVCAVSPPPPPRNPN